MHEFVVDAAAAIGALSGKDAVGIALRKRIAEATCHAPHLIDAEVGHVLRRRERRGEITEEVALTGLRALPELIDHRYPHAGRLSEHAWDLRHTITFYDGLYVALAAALKVPLLTSDVRLSNAPGLSCRVELVE
ncbi:type II toxin-antitoxin system VapC family toxin [Solihabitans fulvus]|uniref:Ribonuclease VapC n=1 Tax=Solihabitans fulvus TaxID=1892852 RepID=A0A5B2X5X8_9PSEU|nr:type II toxin-antitoxin system VapC family toxin [Solihabitans fulvus]KAA2258757.1 type II toxin-antitoxin system VapC family toxin [Solihabitans fulvus]